MCLAKTRLPAPTSIPTRSTKSIDPRKKSFDGDVGWLNKELSRASRDRLV